MESLSRPFHSRKISNVTSFSAKNAYADAFSGHRHKFTGASTIDVADYREIFGSAQANCSIPVLDVSTLSDASNLNLRHSKPDYSNIFGGFRDEQVAYSELFTRDKREPSIKVPISQDLDNSSNRSFDDLKTFNMSYNKINPNGKNGLDGTKHVTQVPAISGFTRFIDEPVLVSPPKMEAKKSKSSSDPVSEENASVVPIVRKFNTFDTDFGIRSSTVSSPINRRIHPKRSEVINSESYKTDTSESGPGGFSRTYFVQDVNSDASASASAAALKKAIEKAQESIRIAKESVGRKKKGLKSFSKKDKMDDVNTQVFHDVGTNRNDGGTVNYQGFMDGEKLFVAKKVIDEMNEKISESTNERCNRFEDNVTESRSVGSSENDECVTESAYQKSNTFVDDYDEKIEVIKTDTDVLEHFDVKERESVEKVYEMDETIDDELTEELNKLSASQNVEEDEKDNHVGEKMDESVDDTMDNEYDEDSSLDDNVLDENDNIDEIHVASNVVFTSDNVETTHDVDNVETESMDQDASEDEAFSDENEDDFEVKSEENDTRSRSSSGTIRDVKLDVEESNEEKNVPEETNEIPDVKTTNEMKASRVPFVVNETTKADKIDETTVKNNRLAVERAIREARERAFVEARERAERERVAVKKATDEVRQRMMADAREKVVKNNNNKSSSSSAQLKLRAERAAVERATAEARQRALEKAISQKNVSDFNISESALRTKAKLEKHNRIMERAAKALAEKEKRDILAQKEQAERNRLSENLDADIKRWSNGKEKNLRALLSTLQYILGPESGWKPVTMTEIISSSAVKKAYRKATLCVHPDKLQQRGASIQHKYVCEKVFDLLKAAWNRFNSDEK